MRPEKKLTSGPSAAFPFIHPLQAYPWSLRFIRWDELDAGLFQGCLDLPKRFCRPPDFCRGFDSPDRCDVNGRPFCKIGLTKVQQTPGGLDLARINHAVAALDTKRA